MRAKRFMWEYVSHLVKTMRERGVDEDIREQFRSRCAEYIHNYERGLCTVEDVMFCITNLSAHWKEVTSV